MTKPHIEINTKLLITDFEAGYLNDIMVSNNFDSINDAFRFLLHEYIGDTNINFDLYSDMKGVFYE